VRTAARLPSPAPGGMADRPEKRRKHDCPVPSYTSLIAERPVELFPGARVCGPLQAAQRRLLFALQLLPRLRALVCPDIVETVGQSLRHVGGLDALLRHCGLTLHKAIFVRILTDALDNAPGAAMLPARYSQLSCDQKLAVLAWWVHSDRPSVRRFRHIMRYCDISAKRSRFIEGTLRTIMRSSAPVVLARCGYGHYEL
jgi:hypothetical protein